MTNMETHVEIVELVCENEDCPNFNVEIIGELTCYVRDGKRNEDWTCEECDSQYSTVYL